MSALPCAPQGPVVLQLVSFALWEVSSQTSVSEHRTGTLSTWVQGSWALTPSDPGRGTLWAAGNPSVIWELWSKSVILFLIP